MNQMKLHRSDMFIVVELVFNKVMSIILMLYSRQEMLKERSAVQMDRQ